MLKKILQSDVIYYFSATMLSRGSIFLTMPLLLLVINPSEYGDLLIAVTVSRILSRLFNLSGVTAILREGTVNHSYAGFLASIYNGTTFYFFFAFSLLFFLAFALLDYNKLFLAIPLLSASEAIFSNRTFYLRAVNRPEDYLFTSVVRLIVEVLAIGCMWFFELSLFQYAGLLSIFTLIGLYSSPYHFNFYSIKKVALEHSYTLPVILSNILTWILNSSDKLVIKTMLGSDSVTYYSIGYNIASLVLLLTSTLAVYLPSKMFSEPTIWISKTMKTKYYFACSFASITLSLMAYGIFLLDEATFKLFKFHGPEIHRVLLTTLVGAIFSTLMVYPANILVHFRKTAYLLKVDVFVALSNIGLNILVIPYLGIWGAAITTSICFILQFLLLEVEGRKHFQ